MPATVMVADSIVGHFRIKSHLGEGGMATVYLAEDITLGRRVALKFLSRERLIGHGSSTTEEQVQARFIREARHAASVNHPNIAQIYEAGFLREPWFIAMEYVAGGTLHDRIQSGYRFAPREIVDIALQMVNGLAHAWDEFRLIHRDVKPQNVMLTDRGVLKIVDLGLARPQISGDRQLGRLTEAGLVVGSPLYMPPEQCEGVADLDCRADIYALGATLYEVAAGRRAFDGKTPFHVYRAHCERAYVPLRDIRGDLPDDLIAFVDDLLEPDVKKRPRDYDDLRRRLEASRADCVGDDAVPGVYGVLPDNVPDAPTMVDTAPAAPPAADVPADSSPTAVALPQHVSQTHTSRVVNLPLPKGHDEDAVHERTEMLLELIKSHGNLPALEGNVVEVCSMARRKTAKVADLTGIIMRDTALTANLLQIINSALFGLRVPVRTITNAVILLGFDRVQQLALRLAIFRNSCKSARSKTLFRLLTGAYFSGTFARQFCARAGYGNPEEAFVAGLLQRLPRQALAATFPEDFRRMERIMAKEHIDQHAACRRVFAADYDLLCHGIVAAWNLPDGIAESLVAIEDDRLGQMVQEASMLSDVILGPGGDRHAIEAVQHRIGRLLHDDKFSIADFLADVCQRDANISRVFNIDDSDLTAVVEHIRRGESTALSQQLSAVDPHSPSSLTEDVLAELVTTLRDHQNINDGLLVAQEALYRCLEPRHVVTVFMNRGHTHLVGRFYVGEADDLQPRLFRLSLRAPDLAVIGAMYADQPVVITGSRLRRSIPRDLQHVLPGDRALAAPIKVLGNPVGVYLIVRDQPDFTDSERTLTRAVAQEVGMAFARARHTPA